MWELKPNNFVQSRTKLLQIHLFLDPKHVKQGTGEFQQLLMLPFLWFLDGWFCKKLDHLRCLRNHDLGNLEILLSIHNQYLNHAISSNVTDLIFLSPSKSFHYEAISSNASDSIMVICYITKYIRQSNFIFKSCNPWGNLM